VKFRSSSLGQLPGRSTPMAHGLAGMEAFLPVFTLNLPQNRCSEPLHCATITTYYASIHVARKRVRFRTSSLGQLVEIAAPEARVSMDLTAQRLTEVTGARVSFTSEIS